MNLGPILKLEIAHLREQVVHMLSKYNEDLQRVVQTELERVMAHELHASIERAIQQAVRDKCKSVVELAVTEAMYNPKVRGRIEQLVIGALLEKRQEER